MFLLQCNIPDLCNEAAEASVEVVAGGGLPIGAQVGLGLFGSVVCVVVGGGVAYLVYHISKRCAVASPPTDPEAAPQAATPPPAAAAGDMAAPPAAAGVVDMAAQPAPEVAARLHALDEEANGRGFFGRFWPLT